MAGIVRLSGETQEEKVVNYLMAKSHTPNRSPNVHFYIISLIHVKECGWELLTDRRLKHRIISYFYEIQNGLVPNYLRDLVPPTVGSTMSHNVRNSHNIHNIAFITSPYGNSFLPSEIREWKELSFEIRTTDSLNILKSNINRNKPILIR